MVLVSAFMLLYNIRLHPHKPEELYVNIAAAQKAAEAKARTAARSDAMRLRRGVQVHCRTPYAARFPERAAL